MTSPEFDFSPQNSSYSRGKAETTSLLLKFQMKNVICNALRLVYSWSVIVQTIFGKEMGYINNYARTRVSKQDQPKQTKLFGNATQVRKKKIKMGGTIAEVKGGFIL